MAIKFDAPFVCKIKFYDPSGKNPAKNAAHIKYIGTRPGTDLSEPNIDDEESEVFRDPDPDSAAGHVKYAHERPGSHGLFSSHDTKLDLNELQKELGEHEGVVWRMVLSLKEEDALRLDFTNRKKWEETMRASVPDAAQKMGIGESNLRWVAAFHQEQGHPHAHLILWENNPRRSKGLLSKGERKDVKKVFMREIYADERTRLLQEKTAMRDLIRDLGKGESIKASSLIKEVREMDAEVSLEHMLTGTKKLGIPPKIYDDTLKGLSLRIEQLSKHLPDRGRMGYQFMPDEVKNEVREISNWLLHQPAFKTYVDRYLEAHEDVTKHYTFDAAEIDKAKKKAMEDLQKRLSQVVLRAAKESTQNKLFTIDDNQAEKANELFARAKGTIRDHTEWKVVQSISSTLSKFNLDRDHQMKIFNQWSQQADLKVTTKEISNLIQTKGPIREEVTEKDIQIFAKIMKLSGHDHLIKDRLQEHVHQDKKEGYLKNDVVAKASETETSRMDWDRLNRLLGTKVDYAWEERDETLITHEKRDELIHKFETAEQAKNQGWTTFCMNVALKQSGVLAEERTNIIQSWAEKTRLSEQEVSGILKSVENNETQFLRNETWEIVKSNLNIDMDYPWTTEPGMQLNRSQLNHALDQFTKIHIEDLPVDHKHWAAEQISTLSRTAGRDVESVMQWNKEYVKLDQKKWSEVMLKAGKRQHDLSVLRKEFGIASQINKQITNYAKVLLASGTLERDLSHRVQRWNKISQSHVSDDKITQCVERALKQWKDSREWGDDFILSKKDYRDLSQELKVSDPPYFWRPIEGLVRSPSMQIARSVWKSAWNSIEQVGMQTEAQSEMEKRKSQQRQQRQMRQQTHERD